MTKYAQYYQKMWDEHQEILRSFQEVHDAYQHDRKNKAAKQAFDSVGKAARDIMQEWDQRLCQQMERGNNGVFSSKVSEKFWNEVKKDFPLIDFVGVEVTFR